ncbi:MAG: protein kinase domain-containing protein [Limisphaerales bacterium]
MELVERIGSGGYGEVWLCRNALGGLRAVKIVRRAEFDDDRPYDREFSGIRKFEPISRTHEGFVDLLQVGRNDTEGWFYYVMELADPIPTSVGDDVRSLTSDFPPKLELPASNLATSYTPRTLASEVKLRGAIPLDECLRIARSLTRALAELHRHDLVHRDIKPSNIIFVGGIPKLADIGLVASATDARSFVGTEGFIPPEGPGTPQADLYSLGILLYVIATGKTHRDFPEPAADLAARPDRACYLELSVIIHRACQANPRDRYQTATALLADLERLQSGQSIKRRHAIQRVWKWSWKAAACLGLAALLFLFVKNERQRRSVLAEQNLTPWEKHGTTNIAAWQAWQRALQMGNTYTTAGLSNAIQEWERAAALDPNYVAAWSTLSVTITIAVTEGYLPGTNALPRAKFCAQTAIALKPKAGAPYGSLAQCTLDMDYDFTKAEPLFRKGIELDPANWISRSNFAWELLYQGHFAEAEQIWKRIKQEQPEREGSYVGLGYLACSVGNYADGLALFDDGIRLAPNRPRWRMIRGDFLWALNQHPVAAQDWLDEVELGGFPFLDRESDSATLRQVLNQRGPEAFLDRLIALCEERQRAGQFVSGFDLARLYAHAGNHAKALDNLERAIDEHRGMLLSVNVNPAFKSLRNEPRFHAVLRRLKLEK